MIKLALTALTALLTLPLCAQEAEAGHADWYADFDEAVAVATKEKKDLFVDFTGSDWCGWCKRLHAEVFDHEEWLTEVKKSWVLVALDFPRDEEIKAKVPNPERNEELQKKYGVGGFPTILLMDMSGEVYGRTGYRQGGPEAYLEHMQTLRTEGKEALAKAKQLGKAFAAATGADRDKIIGEAIAALEGADEDRVDLPILAPIVKAGLGNEAIALKAVTVLLKCGQLDDEVLGRARALDPKNEQGLLERSVQAQAGKVQSEEQIAPAAKAIDDLFAIGALKDKEIEENLLANAAFWNHRFLKNKEAAAKYAAKLEELAGDNPRYKRLLDMIKNDK
jgi:thioredoxin-related protein